MYFSVPCVSSKSLESSFNLATSNSSVFVLYILSRNWFVNLFQTEALDDFLLKHLPIFGRDGGGGSLFIFWVKLYDNYVF